MATLEDDRRYVIGQFQLLYGRQPSGGELTEQVGYLQRGLSRSQWMTNNERSQAGPAVEKLFRDEMGRPPTAEELSYFAGRIENTGVTRDELRRHLAGTAEALLRPPTAPGAADVQNPQGAATIKSLLSTYGLDELAPSVDEWVRKGLSWAEIEVQLRDPSTAPGKVVDRLYPELQIRTKAGKQPMSIDQIQGYRTNALQMMRASGVPQGFYDTPADMQAFIVGDVSLTELRDRIGEYEQFGAQIAAGATGELDLFTRAYGVQPSAMQLAALVLDPDKALPGLRRQFSAVRLDVAAGRAGYGDLSASEAERLADVGVTGQQATAGFGQLQQSRELFNALPGQENGEDAIGRDEQLGAAFEGNAGAQQKVMNRAERRKAAFGSGGSFAETRDGVAGLGKAR